MMMRFNILLVILLFIGCTAQHWNVDWARENNISIIEVEVPGKSWPTAENFLNSYIANQNVVTVFNVPMEHWDKILKKYQVGLKAACFFYAPSVIFRMDKYPCLEHELGHLREYLEGVPYHTKYAPDSLLINWRWFIDSFD